MNIKEVYEKYKHLDRVLTDPDMNSTFLDNILLDLWSSIRAANVPANPLEPATGDTSNALKNDPPRERMCKEALC